MPLYKNIVEGDLDIWLNNLKELAKTITSTKDKFLIAYFFLSLYEYCQVVCHFRVYGNKYNKDFNAVLKDIKLCLNSNDEQLKYVLNTFHDVRNTFGHNTLSSTSISILNKLISNKTVFIELLKEINIDSELVNDTSNLLDIL